MQAPMLLWFGNKPTSKAIITRAVRYCLPERHQMMHDLLPNSQYISIKDAGHLPTLEQPDAVNKTLIDWLNG